MVNRRALLSLELRFLVSGGVRELCVVGLHVFWCIGILSWRLGVSCGDGLRVEI